MSVERKSIAGCPSTGKDYQPKHFLWELSDNGRVATIRLTWPECMSPLAFEGYAELRDLFHDLVYASDIRVIVLAGVGSNISSGADGLEMIEPLTHVATPDLLAAARMTGDLVNAMKRCSQPIIAAVDNWCNEVGAILAVASDMRLATPETKIGFLSPRTALTSTGFCGILSGIMGRGRAAELLFTGRSMSASEGLAWGFYNAVHPSGQLEAKAIELAQSLSDASPFRRMMFRGASSQQAPAADFAAGY